MLRRLCFALLLLVAPFGAAAQAPVAPSGQVELPPDLQRWVAVQSVIVRQARVSPSAYHNPELGSAEVEAMRAAVRVARSDFERDIATLRVEVETASIDRAVAEDQLRMLQRFSDLAAYMERNRLAMIDGGMPFQIGSTLNLLALFRDVDLAVAAASEAIEGYSPPGSLAQLWSRALTISQRVSALDKTARIAVLEDNAEALGGATAALVAIADEVRALSEQFRVATDMPANLVHIRPLLADAARRHADALSTHAASWRALTVDGVVGARDEGAPNLILELAEIAAAAPPASL